MTRLFLDTEFTGLHQDTSLISIALVKDENNFFYAELTDYDKAQTEGNEWLEENVLEHLFLTKQIDIQENKWHIKGDTTLVKEQLISFLEQYKDVKIWSDCLAYDWVLFCEIFGGAFGLPKAIFYMPFDLVTAFQLNNIDPDIKRTDYIKEDLHTIRGQQHNALFDAKVMKLCFDKLLKNTNA